MSVPRAPGCGGLVEGVILEMKRFAAPHTGDRQATCDRIFQTYYRLSFRVDPGCYGKIPLMLLNKVGALKSTFII